METANHLQVHLPIVRLRRRPIPKEKQLQHISPEISKLHSEKKNVEISLAKIDIGLTPIEDINKIL
jgi:hypothetical protein